MDLSLHLAEQFLHPETVPHLAVHQPAGREPALPVLLTQRARVVCQAQPPIRTTSNQPKTWLITHTTQQLKDVDV